MSRPEEIASTGPLTLSLDTALDLAISWLSARASNLSPKRRPRLSATEKQANQAKRKTRKRQRDARQKGRT